MQNTLPSGKLSDRKPIHGVPAPPEKCWSKQVVFLTDPLTYDLTGHCIEGNGIPVDAAYPISFDEGALIKVADEMAW